MEICYSCVISWPLPGLFVAGGAREPEFLVWRTLGELLGELRCREGVSLSMHLCLNTVWGIGSLFCTVFLLTEQTGISQVGFWWVVSL